MKLCDQAQRLGEALTEYTDLLAELSAAEAQAEKLAREINTRMSEERAQDQKRIDKLKKALADSPRVEYARIVEKLDEDSQDENMAEYWMRQYGHAGGKNRLYPDERKRLEKRKREIERMVLFEPPTPEESELSLLERKQYKPTVTETKAAAASKAALDEAHTLEKETRDELRAALTDLDEALKPIRQQLTLDGIELTERAYRSAMEAVERIARWN